MASSPRSTLRAFASSLRTAGTGVASRLSHRPKFVLFAAALVFVLVYAGQEILRFWAFRTYAWDLGLSNQAFYTTLFDHRVFFYTADLPSGISGSLALGTHFSPFLALLLPFYAVLPSPSTLIVLQWIGLALAAFPLYALTKLETHSTKVAAALAIIYLISPVTAASGWYDFHPEAFIPVTVLAALYFYRTRRWAWFLGSWILALSVTEPVILLLGIFAISLIVSDLAVQSNPPLRERLRLSETLAAVAALAITLLWLVLAFLVVRSQNPGGGVFGTDYGAFWTVLGAPSIVQVIPTAILHPGSALAALGFDGTQKAAFVLILLGSVGFVVLAGLPRYLFPMCGWLALAVLSNNPAYFSFGSQYTCYLLPFLFAGTASGLAILIARVTAEPSSTHATPRIFSLPRLNKWTGLSGKPTARRTVLVVSIIIIGILVTSGVSSPLLAKPYLSFGDGATGLTSVTPHDELLHRVISLIPSQASVLTSNNLFPEVSGRLNAYVVPFSSYFAGNQTFEGVLKGYVAQVNYILFDYTVDPFGAWAITSATNFSGFGVLAESSGIVLYERGWSGSPMIWAPMIHSFPGGNLKGFASGERIFPPTKRSFSALSVPPHPTGTWLLYGPGLGNLPAGVYRETFNITLNSNPAGPLLKFDANRTSLELQATVVNPSTAGKDYVIKFLEGTNQTVNSTLLGANTTSLLPENYTVAVTFQWSSPAVWYVNIQERSPYVSFTLNDVELTQLSPS